MLHGAKFFRSKKGQGLVEYALIIGAVALIAIIAVSILGNKTADIIGTLAVIMPGAHDEDEGSLIIGRLVETTHDEDGNVVLDASAVISASGSRIASNLGIDASDMASIILEP